jgi:DNA-binding response OmpR family regulator
VLDPESYEVRVRGACVDLTLKEYELLKHLITHPGRVFTRDQLLSGIWGYEYFGGTRTVDVHIRRLRMKLGEVGERSIDTVRGVGYVFRP